MGLGVPAAGALPSPTLLNSVVPAAPGAGGAAAAPDVTAQGQAQQMERAGSEGDPAAAGAVYDRSKAAGVSEADVVVAPRELGLSSDVLSKVDEFTAEVMMRAMQTYPEVGFHRRDFIAWRNFIRHFTPQYGLQEALRRGALYVFRDRLETEAERDGFYTPAKEDGRVPASGILEQELAKLRLPDPNVGRNDRLAAALMKYADPTPEELQPDEASPFQIPLAELVPNKESANLIRSAEVLNRIDSISEAFALRDFTLMVGPPAAVKSAIPRYMASQFGIPYLAVTMHPGIGTFELIGGYRPKELKIHDMKEARSVVQQALKRAKKTKEYGAFIAAATMVYGAGSIETFEQRAEADVAHGNTRELLTLAHALRFGESSLVWQDGYLTYALKRDIWINFEELNAAPTEVLEFLNEFMRSRRLVVTQKLGQQQVLTPKPGGRFMLFATMNPETDSNRNVLAKTLKSRWRIKHFGDLPNMDAAWIIEQKYGMPSTWALALVNNLHKPFVDKARARVIGGEWRDGYVYNFRHLLRAAKRWRHFVDLGGHKADSVASLALLAREYNSVYASQLRDQTLKDTIYTELDQALRLHGNGITKESITVRPAGIEDLGDKIRIGDVVLKKGPGGPFTPKLDPDYVTDDATWPRLYEYAKALSLGEPILLVGESGVGKTTDIEYLFHRLNYNLHYKNLDSDTAYEEVVGGYVTGDRRGVYVFAEGMMPRAIEEGSGAHLDEINLSPVGEWLNTVIDDGSLYLPHRIVRGKPFLVGAANPPEPSRYGGRLLMSPAFRSRWQEFWVADTFDKASAKRMMRRWLGGASALFGRSQAGVASWSDSVRDLINRLPFGKKKSGNAEPPVEDAPADEGQSGSPATIDELLRRSKIPEHEWPAVRKKIEAVESKIRMIGSTVGRDVTLDFQPGEAWAYWFDSNTITYPLDFLLKNPEEAVVGVVDHEGGHRDITVIDQSLPVVRKFMEDPEKHFLWNAVEDPRVNNWVIKRLPGARRYMHALYDLYVPDSMENVAKAAPSQEEIEKIMKGDGGTAFDPRLLGLPHIEFTWAMQYYWRHGKVPELKSPSAREAFKKAVPHLDRIYQHYPTEDDPTQRRRLAYTVDTVKQIEQHLLPLYEPLVKRSKEKMARSSRSGKGKGSGGQGQNKGQSKGAGGNGMSQPSQQPPQPPKNQQPPKDGQKKEGQGQPGQDGEPKDEDQDKKDGQGGGGKDEKKDPDQKKDGQGGGGKDEKKEEKKSWRERLFGKKDGKKDEDYDDGDPEPGRRPDEHDAQAEKALKDLAKKAAEELAAKVPKTKNAGRNVTKGQGPKGGDQTAKPLTLQDVVDTQKEILLKDGATPWQRYYRQVADSANQMVTHLDNLFVKNARPGDTGYYRQGRKPDMQRVMRLEGQGGARDDVWLRRNEATKRKYRVTLLVDESISMMGKRHPALQATVMLVETMHRLQIDVEVIGFAGTATVHFPYGQQLSPQAKEKLLATLDETVGKGSGTYDADAVKLAYDRIIKEEADEKIIFVVTDGEGNGPSKLTSILPVAEAAKVGVIGVGVGEGMAYVKESYQRHVLVPEFWQLPAKLKAEVQKFIFEREMKALNARRRGGGMSFWAAPAEVPGRFPLRWRHRVLFPFLEKAFAKNSFMYWAQLSWIIPAAMLPFTGALPAMIGLLIGLFIVASLSIWDGQRQHNNWFRAELIPEGREAALLAAYKRMTPEERAVVETALEGTAPGRERWVLDLSHPFHGLVSAYHAHRETAWAKAWPLLAAAAKRDAKAWADLIADPKGELTDGELEALGELGPAGREILVREAKLGKEPAMQRLIESITMYGTQPGERDVLKAMFELRKHEAGLKALADSRDRGSLEQLVAPDADDAGAVVRRARETLAKPSGDAPSERWRRDEIARALAAVEAAPDSEDGRLARQRLESLLVDGR